MNIKLSIFCLSGLSLVLSIGAFAVSSMADGYSDDVDWSYVNGLEPKATQNTVSEATKGTIAPVEDGITCTEGCRGRNSSDVLPLKLTYEGEAAPVSEKIASYGPNDYLAQDESFSSLNNSPVVDTQYLTTNKTQYPVTRQYPISVEYPITIQRDVTVEQPVIIQQPVIMRRPVVMQQAVTVQRQPQIIQQQPQVIQQQPTFIQRQPMVVQAPTAPVDPTTLYNMRLQQQGFGYQMKAPAPITTPADTASPVPASEQKRQVPMVPTVPSQQFVQMPSYISYPVPASMPIATMNTQAMPIVTVPQVGMQQMQQPVY